MPGRIMKNQKATKKPATNRHNSAEVGRSYTIHAVEKAIAMLEMFSEAGGELRLTDICRRLEMSKSQAFRLLATFQGKGLVRKSETNGGYRLGLLAYALWGKAQSQFSALDRYQILMTEIHRRLNEAVYLAVSDDSHLLLLDMIDTTHPVHAISLVGKSYPLDASVAGKVILAFGPAWRDEDEALSAAALEELETIRRVCGASDCGVLGDGITCVAVPLFDATGQVYSSLCVIGPQFRLPESRIIEEILPVMLETSSMGIGIEPSAAPWAAASA